MSRRCGHDPAAVIARQPLFASLSADESRGLAERSPCRAARRGEILFREGDTCRGTFLVLEGEVRVYRANSTGREQVIATYATGECVGEAAVFDAGPYLASARVTREGRILFLPFDEVHALYETHPEVARAVVRELGARVRKLAALLDRMTLQDVPTRVAGAVLEEAKAAGAAFSGAQFDLSRTQEEMAVELGAARESVARALRELREADVIEQRGRRVRVRNLAALAKAAATPLEELRRAS